MTALLTPLRPYLKLVSAYPLHLAASLAAALLSEVLLTVQPRFIRGFIDQAQSGLDRRELWLFPAFMLGAAALAYAFDLIAVSIGYYLRMLLAHRLKEVYIEFCAGRRSELLEFTLRTGIEKLAALALSVSLDLVLVLARLGLILGFLALEHWGLGLATALAMAASLGLTTASTMRIGRLSRGIQLLTARLVRSARRGGRAAGGLDRLYGYDQSRFLLRTANMALAFTQFRVLPLSVLAWYLLSADASLGAVAASVLYFSMLQAPYRELLRLLQESTVAFSESSLFRHELERGMAVENALWRAPAGLLWLRDGVKAGAPLGSRGSRELFDDEPPGAPGKAARLRALAEACRERSAVLHSDDPLVRLFAHFVVGPGGRLQTPLKDADPAELKALAEAPA